MNFRQVNKKIGTIGNVKKITNAMHMVSSVKMKKAQKIALEGKDYRHVLERILARVLSHSHEVKDLRHPFLAEGAGNRTLLLLISSNKGLCGSFHTNLFAQLLANVDFATCDFITVGSKGAAFVTQCGGTILADFSQSHDSTENVSAIVSLMHDTFLSGTYKRMYMLSTAFYSSMHIAPNYQLLLPISDLDELTDAHTGSADRSYIIEPLATDLLGPLLQNYVEEKVRGALIESTAAEHSARMIAMKNATESAGELIDGLTLLRNKLRQSQITGELLDMIGAQESTHYPLHA